MDISTIFQTAKDGMLRDGEHRPLLLVESVPLGMTMIAFADFPYETTFEKEKAFFAIGMKYGKETPGEELRQIAFIVESWLSHDPTCKAPSQDPNRKEGITVWTISIDGKSVSQDGYVAEIIRQGETIDLLDYTFLGKVHNKILLAFLAGWTATRISDKDLAKIVASL